MTHKSVTCALFPNKASIPLTEKINYTCNSFWRRDLPILSFLPHEYFTCFICVVCFPSQVSSFTAKFSLDARFQNLFLPPHPHQTNFLSIPLPRTGSSNRRCRNHNFNHIYVLPEHRRSSQVTHRSLSRPGLIA